ncbi:Uncharacterised protein [Mycobacteroides abscessus subsp. abscessus]|nr:Uncharacterised protein [Mycobacteroides abscessus subsp. abscessus]
MVAAYDLVVNVSSPMILVARSIPMTSTPVAIGSRVPACPTLRVENILRQRDTTSWLVIPAGLSTITRPARLSGSVTAPRSRSRSNPCR